MVTDLPVPSNFEGLNGRPLVDVFRPMLDKAGVHGEVSMIRRIAKENRVLLNVVIPGRDVSVDLNTATRSATISEPPGSSLPAASIFLHKMPGQHLANLRGNWLYLRLWAWLADVSVYLVFFLSLSGVYLWAVLRAERRIGLILIAAGVLSFFGVLYAVIS